MQKMILVLAQNAANRKIDGINKKKFVADITANLNFEPQIEHFDAGDADKRTAIYTPRRNIRNHWSSVLDWLDPTMNNAQNSKDDIENWDPLAGYLGLIPESVPVRLHNFGFKWDSKD